MPAALPRPCPVQGCSRLVRGGRCPVHGSRSQRGNAERGGSGGAWQALREAAFARDGGFCVLCGMRLMLSTARIDHIRPLSEGGTNDLVNLRTLCLPCHRGLPTTRGGG